MSDIPKRYEHFLSPDGVRKLSQLMKSHFASYPDKDKLYNDSKGLQYNGSVYNFGSEILLETNKLKMTKPPIRNLKYGKDTTFYFDIDYSYLIDTYEQQNMLVCNLKKDVLVASHQYYLEFRNISEFYVIRSTNTSAGNKVTPDSEKRVQQSIVFKDLFYKTNDFPVLVEKYTNENNEVVYVDHELRIRDGETFPTFYFHSNELTDGYIDSIVDGTLTTVLLDDNMNGLPFIWFTTESFKYLPSIDLDNNIDAENHPFLTFGTDGNGVSRIYPNCYTNNFPPYDASLNYEWYIKIESRDGFNFIADDEPGNKDLNYGIPIKSITLLYSNVVNKEPSDCVKRTITIPENANYVIYLDKNIYHTWSFSKRLPTDDDWDGVTFNNPNYAYSLYEADGSVTQRSFSGNHMNLGYMIAGFKIKFFNEYLYPWESEMVGDVSGIHIDSTDERSNNGIIEKNGVSHMLGDFDGLPTYMNMQLKNTIHHSHVDIYAIRDHNNEYTQLPMKKQTAGILLDSAIPQNELSELIMSDPGIVYDSYVSNMYYTLNDKIISPKNVLTNITYADNEKNVFSDYTNIGSKRYKRFFYHGSNYFSLDVFGLDPLTEFARGYIVSNDPPVYENNRETDYVKPGRTIARICDIPTTMINMLNIPNYAPSILIDWNTSDVPYVRTFCNFETTDMERLRNNPYDTWIKHENIVFPVDYDLENVIPTYGDRYKTTINMNATTELTFGETGNTTVSINEPGSGYVVGERFKFNIGGRYFIGEVTELNGSSVHAVTIISYNFSNINVSNLINQTSTYHTMSINGDGVGLIINLTLDDDTWNSIQPITLNSYINGLHLYKYDEYGHVWLYEYDHDKWNGFQITGPSVTPNPYDLDKPYKRKMVDVFIMNMLNNNRKLFYLTFDGEINTNNQLSITTQQTDIDVSEIGMNDISETLRTKNINHQNAYYIPYVNDVDNRVDVRVYNRYPYTRQDNVFGKYHNTILPRYNNLNVSSFFNIANRISYTIHRYKLHSQPDLFYYNPLEPNYIKYENISTDYHTIKEKRLFTYVDLFNEEEFSLLSNRYVTNNNIYNYNEYVSDAFEILREQLQSMDRDQLITYIRNKYGDNAFPVTVDAINPYTKEMLIEYCLSIPETLYSKSNIKMVAQKFTSVAQIVFDDYGNQSIVPTDGEPITGSFEPLSYTIHDLNYQTNVEVEPDILFVFNVKKHDQIVTFKNYHIYDENDVDISKHSLLIYDGKKYLYDSNTDNWYATI